MDIIEQTEKVCRSTVHTTNNRKLADVYIISIEHWEAIKKHIQSLSKTSPIADTTIPPKKATSKSCPHCKNGIMNYGSQLQPDLDECYKCKGTGKTS